MSECEHTDKERQIAEIDSCPICLAARLAKVERLAAMLRDPKQWIHNEYTIRISRELDASLDRETASRG